MSSIPPLLRRRLRAEAIELYCAYCHSPEKLLGIPLEADHITATSRGGKTVIGNLCLCCRTCNGHKWQITTARDPATAHRQALSPDAGRNGRCISNGAPTVRAFSV